MDLQISIIPGYFRFNNTVTLFAYTYAMIYVDLTLFIRSMKQLPLLKMRIQSCSQLFSPRPQYGSSNVKLITNASTRKLISCVKINYREPSCRRKYWFLHLCKPQLTFSQKDEINRLHHNVDVGSIFVVDEPTHFAEKGKAIFSNCTGFCVLQIACKTAGLHKHIFRRVISLAMAFQIKQKELK